jgi:hypothetical protein
MGEANIPKHAVAKKGELRALAAASAPLAHFAERQSVASLSASSAARWRGARALSRQGCKWIAVI